MPRSVVGDDAGRIGDLRRVGAGGTVAAQRMDFRLLGPLEVRDHDRALALGGPRQRALLAVLLLHANRVVSSDRLAYELWGDEPPATLAKSLQVTVSRVRRVLGDGRLVTQAPGYLLRVERDELDAARFERLVSEADAMPPAMAAQQLRDALGMWRGPALADLADESFAQAALRAARGAAHVRARGPHRRRRVARSPRRARRRARGARPRAPVARAAARAAHAVPVPLRPSGRGPRRLPTGASGARRGAGDRAQP